MAANECVGAQLLRTTRGTPRCQKYMFLHPSQSMLTELISSHLTPPHLLSSRLISPHLISSRLISPSYAPYAHSHNSPKHSRGGRRRPTRASPSTAPATPPSGSAWEYWEREAREGGGEIHTNGRGRAPKNSHSGLSTLSLSLSLSMPLSLPLSITDYNDERIHKNTRPST